jgi:predicted transcriptional regulator/RimJ/RimL family protein N-acetyltransferase
MLTRRIPGKEGRKFAILLSIKSEHARRIFERSKHYELRKVLPKVDFGRVFLYESGGAGVVGCFDVEQRIHASIPELWREVGTAATTKDRFDTYFAHAKHGTALKIAAPIKFAEPLSVRAATSSSVHLAVPQSAMTLEEGQPLLNLLENLREQALSQSQPSVTLRPIRDTEKDHYRELVLRHIAPNYAGIDETFADNNLAIHEQGFDPTGYFTTKKEVLTICNGGDRAIGFTTLTYKSGRCVKSGPTILFKGKRGRGYGLATRRAIEERAIALQCRKIYCTCPQNSERVLRYLLSAGMRIEAHLERHYSPKHNELVLGKLLTEDEAGEPLAETLSTQKGEIVDPASLNRKRLIADFRKMFELTWSPVTERLAQAIIHQSIDAQADEPRQKPKRLVAIARNTHCIGAISLLPKRGGAVKGVLLRSTNYPPSINALLDAAVDAAKSFGGRKIYFLHPVLDDACILLLRSRGFRAEGLIRAPYRPGQDGIVMSRFI